MSIEIKKKADLAKLINPFEQPRRYSGLPVTNGVSDREAKYPSRPALSEDALYGITGAFIRLVMPHTEADQAALIVQFLVTAGIYLGRTGFYLVEGTCHHTNLFAVIVGMTSKGRKGTSWGQVRRLYSLVDADFLTHIVSGISTGEGIIHAVRDEIWEEQPVRQNRRVIDCERVKTDSGIEDKRLLIQEAEFARVLKNTQRETNNPSAVIREAWDSGTLNILTKTNPTRATDAHIGIVGHITAEELRRLLTTTETANGFANRFLWIYSERSKELPHGGSLEDGELAEIAARLKALRERVRSIGRVTFDPDARTKWECVYGPLSAGRPGMLGAVLGRAEAQVIRLATLYALLDGVPSIRLEHLMAALAIWKYSEESSSSIFGTALGDETADTIRRLLQAVGGQGASRTEISRFLKNNKSADEIELALGALRLVGYAHNIREMKDVGPPVERWFAGRPEDAKNGIAANAR